MKTGTSLQRDSSNVYLKEYALNQVTLVERGVAYEVSRKAPSADPVCICDWMC